MHCAPVWATVAGMEMSLPRLTVERAALRGGRHGERRAGAMAASVMLHAGLIAAVSLIVVQGRAPRPGPSVELAVEAPVADAAVAPIAPAMVAAAPALDRTPGEVPAVRAVATRAVAARRGGAARPVGAVAAARPALVAPAAVAEEPVAGDALLALTARIRQAVQDAAEYPAMARMMHREGRALVRFDYVDGAVSGVGLAASSRFAMLDAAALAAVYHAAVPAAPPEVGKRRLTLEVWVDFALTREE